MLTANVSTNLRIAGSQWYQGPTFGLANAAFGWVVNNTMAREAHLSRSLEKIVVRRSANFAGTRLVPAMRYRNVAAAIDWLCTAFGFEKHHVTGEEGAILHAHLTLGNSMIMVWPVRDSGLDRLMKQPDEIGGVETQTCYFVVADADVHYRNAKAAGADIVLDINDDDHGGRGYSCRDPEGHIWSFGTYDPWQGNPAAPRFPLAASRGRKLNRPLIVAAIVASITAAATAGWMLPRQTVPNSDDTRLKHDASAAHERAEKAVARATLLAAELTQERTAKDVAERAGLECRFRPIADTRSDASRTAFR